MDDKKSNIPEGAEVTDKESLYKRVRDAFPDEEVGDDAVYSKALSLLDKLKSREDIDSKLKEVFEADPKLGAVFSELIEGKKPFRAILAGHYAADDLIPKEGDEDWGDYEAVLKNKKIDRAKRAEEEERVLKNLENAEKVFIDFSKSKGLDEQGMEAFSSQIQKLLDDLKDGVLSPETLTLFFKGFNYDEDTKVSELRGRNSKIQEKIQEKPIGDGLPDTSGSSKEKVQEPVNENEQWLKNQLSGRRKVL